MVDVCINFKREALMLFPWILSLHLISMNSSLPPPPPPLCPQKGEVNIIPNIRVITVLVVFTELVKKREQLLQIKDISVSKIFLHQNLSLSWYLSVRMPYFSLKYRHHHRLVSSVGRAPVC